MSMMARRRAYLSFLTFLFVLGGAASLSGGQADQKGNATSDRSALHSISSACLYESVQAHSARIAEARQQVASSFEAYAVVRQMGLSTAEMQQRTATLTDSEILALRSQMMRLEEQLKTAGMENRVLVPIVAGVLTGLTVATFMFLY